MPIVIEGVFIVLTAALITAIVYGVVQTRESDYWQDSFHRATAARNHEAREHEKTRARLAREEHAHSVTRETSQKVLLSVVPLVEKTDWMTGRWGGQFNTLVRMENERNANVDRVRRALFSIPFVNDMGINLVRSGR